MKIALGSDHAGYLYKEKIKAVLAGEGHDVKDCGTHSPDMVDYPAYIRPAAEAVARGECERGIVLGGSGNGEAIVANKVRGVRCALCWNEATAKACREHNDANVLSLGERMITAEMALAIVRIFLETPFDPSAGGGRHARRIAMIE
jgi:ribose 5-phosphate isomerase B